MIIKQKALFVVVLAVLIGFGVATNSSAQTDWKSLSGAMCQANNGGQEQYLRHWYTGTYNSHTRHVMVTCSILRDEFSADLISGVGARVEQGAYRTTRCWLQYSNEDVTLTTSLLDTQTGPGWLNWYPSTSYANGIMSIQCSLAPTARLSRIWYREEGTTDAD